MNPLQTLLDERAASFSLKFGDVEHVDCAQENNSNCQAFSQLKERDRDSFLQGVRLGLAMGREEIDNLKFHPKWDAEPIKRVLTAALEAKEKELGV